MVADNLPVDVARDMGADIIIAVTLSHNQATREELKGPSGVANQMLNIYIYDQVNAQLKDADIIIAPELINYTSTSYFKMKEIVALGEEAARKAMPQIKEQVEDIILVDIGVHFIEKAETEEMGTLLAWLHTH